jgi:hypothetical protein
MTSALDGVSGQSHAPAALYPRWKDPRYPLDRRLGGPQSRSGHRLQDFFNAYFSITLPSVSMSPNFLFPSIYLFIYLFRSRVSSVSIVSDYGLDDRAVEVRSPARAKDFFSNLCVQTGSGAHPASCTMRTEGPFSGVKRGRGVTLNTHPYLVPRSWMSRNYTSSPPIASMACSGTALLLLFYLLFNDAFYVTQTI